jgi:hypothetical protein
MVSPKKRGILKSKIEGRTTNKKTKLTIASKTRAGNETFQKVL